MNTDRWYYRVFQSAPDLIRSLLPGSAAAANALGLDPGAPGDQLYRFEALEIKELSHRLDGVLWPRPSTGCAETGSPEFPVVLLESGDTDLPLSAAGGLDQSGRAQPAALFGSPAQPAHAANSPRERTANQQQRYPLQPP
ncbi:DUF2887 domain-containing protein [Cyanobium sp. WKJ7-Wakatipu]|uniref:DUF2887 domain-containing protein n=1 Tax=Cyanobium sp. WKJ7-Wakatipu TaxID=2823726 RepID=UPI0037C02B22|nr:DUF2887 domain-containing protein [Cyanobium sp. WKJ7-Wakatipu]